MQFAALTDVHIPVDHHTRMNHGPWTDSGVIADAHLGADADTGTKLHAIGDHSTGVDPCLGGWLGVKLFEGFGKSQPGITTDGPGQLMLLGKVAQVLLIGDQHRASVAAFETANERVSFF